MRSIEFAARVVQFLKEYKSALVKDGLLFVPRKLNLDLLAQRGISIEEVETTVLSLTADNYTCGPVKTGDSCEAWDFGARVGGEEFDFKLKLAQAVAKYLGLSSRGEARYATISLRSHGNARKQDLHLREVRAFHKHAG
jgi:hypothetical protein